MRAEHVDELIDLYALGALEPGEQSDVASHLEECARCRALLGDARRVVEQLAWTPEQRTPPPDLKYKIRRQIEQLQHQEPAEVRPPQQRQRVRSWWSSLVSPRSGLAAVGLALLLVLGGWNVVLQRRLAALESQVAQQQQMIAQQQQVQALLRAPEARIISMAPEPAAPRAHAKMLIDPKGTDAYLVADGLPLLPGDKTYQLWLVEGEERTSAALFRADDRGEATVYVHTSEPLAEYTGCGVTVEPAAGSDRPSGPRVLRGEFEESGGW